MTAPPEQPRVRGESCNSDVRSWLKTRLEGMPKSRTDTPNSLSSKEPTLEELLRPLRQRYYL